MSKSATDQGGREGEKHGSADGTPRVAVISAYEPEWKALKAALVAPGTHHANGVEFAAGTLGGAGRSCSS